MYKFQIKFNYVLLSFIFSMVKLKWENHFSQHDLIVPHGPTYIRDKF